MHAVDPQQVKRNAQWLTQEEIFLQLLKTHKPGSTRNVTFSGGNPCIHDLSELVDLLRSDGWNIIVETQGTFAPDWLRNVQTISCSPKGPGMGEKTDLNVLDAFLRSTVTHQQLYLKVVIFDERDLEFTRMLIERYGFQRPIFLSLGNTEPEGDLSEDHFEQQLNEYRIIAEDIMTDPLLSKVRFLPQLHHFVWGNQKGK
jgi:7-carboxy-7-deazaguanine synthase